MRKWGERQRPWVRADASPACGSALPRFPGGSRSYLQSPIKSLTGPLISALPQTYTHSLKQFVSPNNSRRLLFSGGESGPGHFPLTLPCDGCFGFSRVISLVYSSHHARWAALPNSCWKGVCQALRGAHSKENPSWGCVSRCHWHNFEEPTGWEDTEHSTHTAGGQTSQKGRHLKQIYIKQGSCMCCRPRGSVAWEGGKRISRRREGCALWLQRDKKKTWTPVRRRSLLWRCKSMSPFPHWPGGLMYAVFFPMIIIIEFCCLRQDEKLFVKRPSWSQPSALWGHKSNRGPYLNPGTTGFSLMRVKKIWVHLVKITKLSRK